MHTGVWALMVSSRLTFIVLIFQKIENFLMLKNKLFFFFRLLIQVTPPCQLETGQQIAAG